MNIEAMNPRSQDLADLAKIVGRLAQAEAKVERSSETLRAMPSDSRARAGRGGGRKATATAKLKIACEARNRIEAEMVVALEALGFGGRAAAEDAGADDDVWSGCTCGSCSKERDQADPPATMDEHRAAAVARLAEFQTQAAGLAAGIGPSEAPQ